MKKLNESTSIKTTVTAIANDIGTPITELYNTLRAMAKNYVDSKGTTKGFQLISSGASSRWFQTFYFNRLQKELYDLTQFSPRTTAQLKTILTSMPKSFNKLSDNLPEVLSDIGAKLQAMDLKANADQWIKSRDAYHDYLIELESDAQGNNEPVANVKPEKSRTQGVQYSQVDQIVNSVLASLPTNVSGDIRNAIARSPNKLAALKQEMDRRQLSESSPYDNVSLIHNKEERSRIKDLKDLYHAFGFLGLKRARHFDKIGMLNANKRELDLLHKMTDEDGNIIPLTDSYFETKIASLIGILESKYQ